MKTKSNLSNHQFYFTTTVLLSLFYITTGCEPKSQSKDLPRIVSLEYSNGQEKLSIYSIKRDKNLDTQYISYYCNGNPKEVYQLRNGLIDGEYKSFQYDGQTKEYGIYQDGMEMGEFISYYPNSYYLSKINWKEGNLHGKSTYFYPNGAPMQTGQYKNGLKDGIWLEYDMQGNVTCRQVFDQGELAS